MRTILALMKSDGVMRSPTKFRTKAVIENHAFPDNELKLCNLSPVKLIFQCHGAGLLRVSCDKYTVAEVCSTGMCNVILLCQVPAGTLLIEPPLDCVLLFVKVVDDEYSLISNSTVK